jgi:hypothetical protein
MLKKLCLAATTCVLFFLLLEGLCSSLIVAYQLWSPHQHRTLSGPSVQYDERLGWVSVPNFHESNYYAPGIYLRTNSQGFRSDEEFTQKVPDGKFRIICSGDSQTYGDGVANNHTWCQDLESIDPRIQSINMAETGYGADQMYLWYKREGARLEHSAHVFAVVTDDFRRMPFSVLGGYGKPVLKLQSDQLVTDNIPVPRRSTFLHWLALKPHPLRQFRSLAMMSSIVEWLFPPRDPSFANGPTDEQARVIDKMFEDLVAIEKQQNSVLVLLYIPSRVSDYEPGGASPPWRRFVREESMKRGFFVVDLIDDFQKLAVTRKDGLFIWPGSTQYFAEAPGHFDDQGHEWVAKELYSRLISIPQVAAKINQRSEDTVAGSAPGAGRANGHAIQN